MDRRQMLCGPMAATGAAQTTRRTGGRPRNVIFILSDDSQRGFDRCVSFRGQGTYMPSKGGPNVDGKRVPQKGYITDELTDYAPDCLRRLDRHQPYFPYLSHKAVHGAVVPTARHQGKYAARQFKFPPTTAPCGEMVQGRPMWVHNQRNSHHGVEFPCHSELGVAGYYKHYAETLCGVDESIGAVFDELKKRGEFDSTLVLYMGDNGFAFGEHGLIDKRTAYDESMRVLLLARCSELFEGGRVSGADGAAAGRASDTLMGS